LPAASPQIGEEQKKAGCRRIVGTPRVNQRLRDVPGWNLKVSRLWRVQHFAAAASACELDRITAKEYRDGYRKPLRLGTF
jgi:hypothetical protein